jgi:hypothetical protein
MNDNYKFNPSTGEFEQNRGWNYSKKSEPKSEWSTLDILGCLVAIYLLLVFIDTKVKRIDFIHKINNELEKKIFKNNQSKVTGIETTIEQPTGEELPNVTGIPAENGEEIPAETDNKMQTEDNVEIPAETDNEMPTEDDEEIPEGTNDEINTGYENYTTDEVEG